MQTDVQNCKFAVTPTTFPSRLCRELTKGALNVRGRVKDQDRPETPEDGNPSGAYIASEHHGRPQWRGTGRGQGDQRAEAPPPVDNSGSNQPAHRGTKGRSEKRCWSNDTLQWGKPSCCLLRSPQIRACSASHARASDQNTLKQGVCRLWQAKISPPPPTKRQRQGGLR